jgi:hypothetical protein
MPAEVRNGAFSRQFFPLRARKMYAADVSKDGEMQFDGLPALVGGQIIDLCEPFNGFGHQQLRHVEGRRLVGLMIAASLADIIGAAIPLAPLNAAFYLRSRCV